MQACEWEQSACVRVELLDTCIAFAVDASFAERVRVRRAGSMVGLVLIAIGSGGIKPCVSAFGADQFGNSEADLKAKSRFFSIFYWAINLGSLFSMIITPILRGALCARIPVLIRAPETHHTRNVLDSRFSNSTTLKDFKHYCSRCQMLRKWQLLPACFWFACTSDDRRNRYVLIIWWGWLLSSWQHPILLFYSHMQFYFFAEPAVTRGTRLKGTSF